MNPWLGAQRGLSTGRLWIGFTPLTVTWLYYLQYLSKEACLKLNEILSPTLTCSES